MEEIHSDLAIDTSCDYTSLTDRSYFYLKIKEEMNKCLL